MNRKLIFGPCAMVVGLTLCVVGLWILLSPVEYQAAAKIEIEPEMVSDGPSGDTYVPYDPYFFETELKAISSDMLLSNVVETLNLSTKWGKRYGRTLETSETISLLRWQIDLRLPRNSKIVEICVTDEDPNEAARIANGIAKAYSDYRIAQHERQMANGIKMLEEDSQKEEIKIKVRQARVEELRKQLHLTNNEPDDILKAHYPEYYEAKQALGHEKFVQELLKAKIESERAEINGEAIPKTIYVVEIAPAVPPTAPIGPNHKLGAVLSACGLAMSGFGFYSLRMSNNREEIKSKPV
jgi:uncharacterized protein involved in exopolysaccharide biosynthesis